MPTTLTAVLSHRYVDSVTLLQASADVLALPGVQDAALVMASELNRGLLRDSGLLVGAAFDAGANDLVIAVRAADEAAAQAALQDAEALLNRRRPSGATVGADDEIAPRSQQSARRLAPDAQLAVISVPGSFAAGEARQALSLGLHVFLFSDNVPLEAEVSLKQQARDQGLLVMGPDCGTALINGVGLGFANVVRRGRIGVVGASGTGIQEVTSLVHQGGSGISHALGTGSHDLHARVGGITTLAALELLRDDPSTEVIVLVSKPADPEVAERVLAALAATGKRAVAYLQGSDLTAPGVKLAQNLEHVARLALGSGPDGGSAIVSTGAAAAGHVRGLFCGGTLCQEAALALDGVLDTQLIDFGDDQYTRGRAHPMIDPTLRNQAIVQAGQDPVVSVLLLDFILGFGAHADPAGAAAPALREALAAASRDGRQLRVLAHVVGTDADPQNLAGQEQTLRALGVEVFGSNYRAAMACRQAVAMARA